MRLFSYLCLAAATDLCVAVPWSNFTAPATPGLPVVLKSALKNQRKLADTTKMRFDLAPPLLRYDADPALCLSGLLGGAAIHTSPYNAALESCDSALRADWSFAFPFVKHVATQQCLTVMRCVRRQHRFCDQTPPRRLVKMAGPPFVAGSPLALQPCSAVPKKAQEWILLTDCAVGCAPFLLGNRRCDPQCDVAACLWDGGDCSPAPTAGPTPPTFSPTKAPTAIPSVAPSSSPASETPSGTPSLSPSLSPSTAPSFSPSAAPSLSPSAAPSFSPSLSPSAAPLSINPSRAPAFTFSPSATPSTAPTPARVSVNATIAHSSGGFYWEQWLVLLVLIAPLFVAVFFVARNLN